MNIVFLDSAQIDGWKIYPERALEIWNSIKNIIKYWEGLSKSKCPSSKSYEAQVKYHTDVLVLCKLQFFAFIASMFKPFLQIFQTDHPMLPFLLHELESLANHLVRLVMRRDAIKKADTILKKLKEKWVKDVNNQLEEDLVDLGAATKDLLRPKFLPRKNRNSRMIVSRL